MQRLPGESSAVVTVGGKRQGAGRKPLPGGSTTAAFTLSKANVEAIARWQQEHACKSASEALRQIIERATS